MTKSTFGYWSAALLAGVLAAACAAAAAVERGMARAQRELAVANLQAADDGYAAVERMLGRAGRLPWLLPGLRAEITARRAAIRYWRADYAGLAEDVAARAEDPVLRITLANAAYRLGQRAGAETRARLDALDRAIVLYAGLLRDGGGRADAAYNYEYLVRLRGLLEAGAEPAAVPLESPLGREGAQPLDEETGLEDVQIYVPRMQDDREMVDEPTPGGDPPIRRRG